MQYSAVVLPYGIAKQCVPLPPCVGHLHASLHYSRMVVLHVIKCSAPYASCWQTNLIDDFWKRGVANHNLLRSISTDMFLQDLT